MLPIIRASYNHFYCRSVKRTMKWTEQTESFFVLTGSVGQLFQPVMLRNGREQERCQILKRCTQKDSRAWFRSTDLWVMGPARFHCATLLSDEKWRNCQYMNILNKKSRCWQLFIKMFTLYLKKTTRSVIRVKKEKHF